MPKSADQKLKILYLLQYLSVNTDFMHPASTADLIKYLESNGIHAERKSIYNDVEALNRLGYFVEYKKERPSGYYISDRDFELAELKLLVDAVQASKFITEKKSNTLISKIEKLTSKHEGRKLQRQVYVANRAKTENENILYTIDPIHEAIATGMRITFNYCEWNIKKELVFRNDGKLYNVDPITLVWKDENYYLVGYDIDDAKIKHYRVDKIVNTSLTDIPRSKLKIIEQFDTAAYEKEHFGMFSGKEEVVAVKFNNKLIGVLIDRFGKDIPIIPHDNNMSKTRIKVQVSDTFFAWIAGFRGDVLIETESVKEQYMKFIEDIRQHF